MGSATSQPPASSATFQFSPKSLRLMLPVIAKPGRRCPCMSRCSPARATTQGHLRVTLGVVWAAGAGVVSPAEMFHPGALEGQRRVAFDVEEVWRAQVPVTPVLAGVHARRVKSNLYMRLLGLLL